MLKKVGANCILEKFIIFSFCPQLSSKIWIWPTYLVGGPPFLNCPKLCEVYLIQMKISLALRSIYYITLQWLHDIDKNILIAFSHFTHKFVVFGDIWTSIYLYHTHKGIMQIPLLHLILYKHLYSIFQGRCSNSILRAWHLIGLTAHTSIMNIVTAYPKDKIICNQTSLKFYRLHTMQRAFP